MVDTLLDECFNENVGTGEALCALGGRAAILGGRHEIGLDQLVASERPDPVAPTGGISLPAGDSVRACLRGKAGSSVSGVLAAGGGRLGTQRTPLRAGRGEMCTGER